MMFVRKNYGLSGSTMFNPIPYHVLGVDNVLRRYMAVQLPGNTNVDSGGNIWPEFPDRPGFNHVIRVATGAHEFVPEGMPHPDSALSRTIPVPNQPNPTPQTPWVPPVQNAPAPAPAPAAPPPSYTQGSQVDVTTGTLIPMVTPNQNTGIVPPAEEKSGSGLLVILGLALAVFAGG